MFVCAFCADCLVLWHLFIPIPIFCCVCMWVPWCVKTVTFYAPGFHSLVTVCNCKINRQSDGDDGRETEPLGNSWVWIGGSICLKQSSLYRFTQAMQAVMCFGLPLTQNCISFGALQSLPSVSLSLSLFIASHQPWGNSPAAAVMPLTANVPWQIPIKLENVTYEY